MAVGLPLNDERRARVVGVEDRKAVADRDEAEHRAAFCREGGQRIATNLLAFRRAAEVFRARAVRIDDLHDGRRRIRHDEVGPHSQFQVTLRRLGKDRPAIPFPLKRATPDVGRVSIERLKQTTRLEREPVALGAPLRRAWMGGDDGQDRQGRRRCRCVQPGKRDHCISIAEIARPRLSHLSAGHSHVMRAIQDALDPGGILSNFGRAGSRWSQA